MGPVRALLDRRGARARAGRRGARALVARIACVALVALAAGCASGASSAGFALVSLQVGGDAPDFARIEAALEALPGVLEVQVDDRDARVDVAYDPARSTRDQLLGAIRELGYEAEAVFRRATPPTAEPPLPPLPEEADGGG
jgi:copper chaperone CopZ